MDLAKLMSVGIRDFSLAFRVPVGKSRRLGFVIKHPNHLKVIKLVLGMSVELVGYSSTAGIVINVHCHFNCLLNFSHGKNIFRWEKGRTWICAIFRREKEPKKSRIPAGINVFCLLPPGDDFPLFFRARNKQQNCEAWAEKNLSLIYDRYQSQYV